MRVIFCLVLAVVYWMVVGELAERIHAWQEKHEHKSGLIFLSSVILLAALLYFHY